MLHDSRCTHHLVKEGRLLENFGPSPVRCMRRGANEPHVVEGQGKAVPSGGPLGRVELRNVLYVPTMVHNLCSRTLSNGAQEAANVNGFFLPRRSPCHIEATTAPADTFCRWACISDDSTSEHEATCGRACAASLSISLQLARERLGHMNIAQVKRAVGSDAVTGQRIAGGDLVSCITCNKTKQTRGSFPPSTSRATRPLEIIHMDIIGPI